MLIEVFTHHSTNGENVKFSIWKRQIQGKIYFYARVVNVDSPDYKNLPEYAKETYYGLNVTYGKLDRVFYSNYLSLKADLLSFYGSKWIMSKV